MLLMLMTPVVQAAYLFVAGSYPSFLGLLLYGFIASQTIDYFDLPRYFY